MLVHVGRWICYGMMYSGLANGCGKDDIVNEI